jgi:putative hemolysin
MRLALLTFLLIGACSRDERGDIGLPPAAKYCTGLGYDLSGTGDCVFPGGDRCELLAFFEATCGQAHSYCATHGGTIAAQAVDMGTSVATLAVCTMPGGATCAEQDFWRTGHCP